MVYNNKILYDRILYSWFDCNIFGNSSIKEKLNARILIISWLINISLTDNSLKFMRNIVNYILIVKLIFLILHIFISNLIIKINNIKMIIFFNSFCFSAQSQKYKLIFLLFAYKWIFHVLICKIIILLQSKLYSF